MFDEMELTVGCVLCLPSVDSVVIAVFSRLCIFRCVMLRQLAKRQHIDYIYPGEFSLEE